MIAILFIIKPNIPLEKIMTKIVKILVYVVLGMISPYPTVIIVTTDQ